MSKENVTVAEKTADYYKAQAILETHKNNVEAAKIEMQKAKEAAKAKRVSRK